MRCAAPRLHGITTNLDLLRAILADEEFGAGRIHTALLDERLDAWTQPRLDDLAMRKAALAAALAEASTATARAKVLEPHPDRVPQRPQPAAHPRRYEPDLTVSYSAGFVQHDLEDVTVVEATPSRVVLDADGVRRDLRVAVGAGWVDVDGPHGSVDLTPVPLFVDPADAVAEGSLLAPMPAAVMSVAVADGQQVAKGDVVVVLEAMKMQHTITAPTDGVVTELSVTAGAQVESGAVLAVIEVPSEGEAVMTIASPSPTSAWRCARPSPPWATSTAATTSSRPPSDGRKTTELWAGGRHARLPRRRVPEEYGGGGGDIGDLAAVCEELAAAGSPLLLMVVSPAIVGTIIAQYGTHEQKQRWLPGLADGTSTFAFSITEPDAGSNSHNIITTAYREDDGWRLTGTKTYISGVDEASHVLVVARTEDARTGKLKPALFLVPTDSEGFTYQRDRHGHRRRRRSSSRCSSTTSGCPPTR